MTLAAALLLACSLGALAQAPAKRPMTFADLMAMKPGGPSSRPSGAKVGSQDVVVEQTAPAHPWTSTTNQPSRIFRK